MTPWWQPRAALHRFVSDLLADDLVRQRHAPLGRPLPWPGDLVLAADLGVDSLERIALATALNEALHLHAAGVEDYLLARHRLADWVEIAEAGLERFSERLTFRTSGSSGLPKPCEHALSALQQETEHLAALFRGRRRLLCAVPSHHIYGFLFTVLLPKALGLPADAVCDIRAHSPAWLAQGARAGDLVVAYPDYWASVARTVPGLAVDVQGVTSTAPCPDATSEALERAGLGRLVQVYGSSETAGIGWRESHRAAYTLMPHWSFDTRTGTLIRQSKDAGQHCHEAPDVLTPADGGRHFHVGARRDAAVQVGGINVFPERVRAVLCRHPLVADAAVRLMRPDEGARLKAFIVPRGQASPESLATELRAWIDRELPVAQRPRAISMGESLPRNAAGKLADWVI